MADNYIQQVLELWASWRIRRHEGAMGYPKKSAFVKESSSGGFWTPEMDSRCYVIDAAVCELLEERKQVIMVYYTQTGTNEQKANRCGISLRTFYSRIEIAKLDLANRL